MVNGVPATFTRKDGLRTMNPTAKKIYTGKELDELYRASLEIARDGELMIIVPDLTSPDMQLKPPKTIPKSSPKDVLSRYDKVVKAFQSLSSDHRKYDVQDEVSASNSNPLSGSVAEKSTHLLQVTIEYSIQSVHGGVSTAGKDHAYAGLVFRKLPAFAREFERTLYSSFSSSSEPENFADSTAKAAKDQVQCLYTTSFTNGSFRDVDGVRCWLPCLDHLDQRLVFDLTILLTRNYHVTSVGKRIPVPKGAKVGKTTKKVHRFFTVNRIPIMQLGFFIGKVETYRMDFHRTKGKIWVATGLNDYIGVGALPPPPPPASHPHTTVPPVTSSSQQNREEGKTATNTQAVSQSGAVKRSRAESEEMSRDPSSAPSSSHTATTTTVSTSMEPPTKRVKSDHPPRPRMMSPHPLDRAAPTSTTPIKNTSQSHSTPSAHHQPSSSSAANKEVSISVRRLYADAVYHTLLGFDLAIRVIQKFINHKYEYDEYTIVFVHELGRDFLAFDAFVLVDAKFLHTSEKVYLEMPTNLLLLKSFLYSWLKSDVPIASYENEFIVHGLIGYLIEFYLEEVYGEEEGKYYLQKRIDTVISLEQQGQGFALCSFYPEQYERFTYYYGEYLIAKAMVLFHLIENKIGGRDTMRIALKQIVKAPPMFAATTIKSAMSISATIDYHDRQHEGPLSPSSLTRNSALSPSGYSQFSSTVYSPTNQHYRVHEGASPDGQSPFSQGSASIETPVAHGSTPYQGGYQSPYVPRGDLSPYVSYGAVSPYIGGTASAYLSALGSMTPRFPDGSSAYDDHTSPLNRQYSQTSEDDWYKDAHLFERSTLTAESFILLLRNASGATSDLDDTFLERYVYQHGVHFLRIIVAISPRVEGKTRTISIHTDQIGYDASTMDFAKHHAKRLELPVTMVEERDNNITRSRVNFGENKETHQQQAYAKPGRRAGKVSAATANKKNAEMTAEESERRERLEKEKEARKSALQLARDREYGIRYALVDPSLTCLSEVQNYSSEALLIEQLNANLDELGSDIDKHKVYFQCQAIRNLARVAGSMTSGPLTTTSTTETPEATSMLSSMTSAAPKINDKTGKYLHLKALSDCLLGVTTTGSDNRTSSSACIFVRAEAAFALARWQNEYSSARVEVEPRPNNWPGMEALLECVFELYLDPVSKAPLPVNLQDESSIYLRNSLLFALSSIRSQQGETPWEVIEVLMMFAEDLDQIDSQQSSLHHLQHPHSTDEEAETDEEADPAFAIPPSNPSSQQYYDATHHRAVVLLSLSRIRFADIDCSTDSTHPITSVVSFAKSVIEDAFTTARTVSRIQYKSHDANLLPSLPFQGIDVAAAITCLAEMDIQTAHNLSLGRGKGESCNKLLNETAVTEEAIFTRMRYQSFFLPPNVALVCLSPSSAPSSSSSSSLKGETAMLMNNLKAHFHYFLCTPLIRLAAFEAFVRLCLALHLAHFERIRQGRVVRKFANSGNDTSSPTLASTSTAESESTTSFMAVVIEAFQSIIERDPSVHVKQQAAQILWDAVLDKPMRVVFEAVSLSSEWFTYGWSDCLGLTLLSQDYSHYHSSERLRALREGGVSSSSSTAGNIPVIALGRAATSNPNSGSGNKPLRPSSSTTTMDLSALTGGNSQDFVALRKHAFHLEGKPLKAAISALHKIISQKCVFNQVRKPCLSYHLFSSDCFSSYQITKSILMRLWLYVFDNKVPHVLSSLVKLPDLAPLYRSIEDLFPQPLKKERLVTHNPKELHLLFNNVRHVTHDQSAFL